MKAIGKKIYVYDSCDEIPIFYFYKLTQEGDLSALIKDVELTKKSKVEKVLNENNKMLLEISESIKNEFKMLKFGVNELRRMKLEGKILFLYTEIKAIEMIFDTFQETNEVEVLSLLNEFKGLSFDKEKPWAKQVDVAESKLKHRRNALRIKTSQYEKKYKVNLDEEELETSSLIKRLDQQAIGIEKGLELGYKIDVKKTSVVRWLNLVDLAEKQYNRLQNGKGSHNDKRSNRRNQKSN